MMSIASYLFGSASIKHANQLDTMRAAESQLMQFAQRFDIFREKGTSSPHIETLDTKVPRSVVPLSNKEACRLFSDESEAELTESLTVHSVKVQSQESAAINSARHPLVLLHGYANGALYFYRNLMGLCSSRTFPTVYALDMLGWGLSSRPAFKLSDDSSVEAAEDFYVESLEAWRKENKIEKMVLGGHSLGGYLSVAYCEKYPERVDRLILIAPVGVPKVEGDHELGNHVPIRFRVMSGLAKKLWRNGITPGSILRSLPDNRGQQMVKGYVQNRMPSIQTEEEKIALSEYLYTNAMLPPSGEFCLHRLLKPMAYAHRPTVERIPKLKVGHVSFIYGDSDWMDVNGGLDVYGRCELERQKLDRSTLVPPPRVEVHQVDQAGHLLMLDNWEEFNNAVLMSAGYESMIPEDSSRPTTVRSQMEDGYFMGGKQEEDAPKIVTPPAVMATA